MNRNTILSLLLIVGLLLIGFAIGFMANAYLVRQRLQPIREMRTEAGFLDMMDRIMDINPEQKKYTDTILIQYYRHNQQLIQSNRQQMKAALDSTVTRLQPHISAQQLEQLDKKRQQIRKFIRGNNNNQPNAPKKRKRLLNAQ
jgi:type VI protein secretion system component VasK